ncbi:MAG: hypothetical protein Q9222_005219 [Ikaeria aurantiellina]
MAENNTHEGVILRKGSSPSNESDIDISPQKEEHKNGSDSENQRADGKIELKEADNMDKLGFAFPTWKKWTILTVIFAVQVSMNFNTSVYPNVVIPLTEAFHVTGQVARIGQMTFLCAYAFGSELWAPWSEDLGRWPVLQLSLFLVNIWQIPCALAPKIGTIIVCRFLGGLSSAGGSVTLGMVADMWEADNQQYAVAYVVLSSVGGTLIGLVIGAFIQRYLSCRNVYWIAPMIFSVLIAIANYCIYMATIDYMVASYGPYSASATGGNALARDFLAGVAAMYSMPFYTNVKGSHKLEYPSTILACLVFLVTIPIYVFYWKGPIIREKSKFAQTLASDRKKKVGAGESEGGRAGNIGEKADAGEMEKGP